jgi:hypothetical protein
MAIVHKIVRWMGGITAVIGLFFFLMVVITSPSGAGLISALTFGGGMILSGAILYRFGAIVEHLLAIRTATEAQLKIFDDRLGKKA